MERQGKKAEKASNITKFRRDKRLAVTGGIRALALLLMLATVLFAVWRYQDDLKLDNIKRLIAYAQASTQGMDGFMQYSFEAGLNTVYVPFDLGLAVVGGDTYRFISGFDISEFSVQLKYASPAISASDHQLLIYDRGNTGYCVANSYSVIRQDSTESPIISAASNRKGAYALVTSESGYRSGVAVYDHRQRLLCRWQTPEYYVLMVSVAPDSDSFAAVSLREAEGSLQTRVLGFSVRAEEAVYSIDLGETDVYSIGHDKSGNLIILCEDGLYLYDKNGAFIAKSDFLSPLILFSHHEEAMPLVALRPLSGTGEQVLIRAFGEDGTVLFEQSFAGDLRDMDYRDGTGYLLFSDRVVSLDLTGDLPVVAEYAGSGARQVLRSSTGECIQVYSDRAQRLAPQSAADPQAADPQYE